jgi:hypothetical protein
MNWTFYNIWNKSLEDREERVLEPREKIWASELGGAYIDRYLKMTAVVPTNPPNPRSLRKFEAGNIWEQIVGYVLCRAGLLIAKQKWISYTYENQFPVSGKLDYIAGGKPDYIKAKETLNKEFGWLPNFVSKATLNIVNILSEQFPNGLPNNILEIKSCSAFMFENYEKKGNASSNHKLQLFHYLKSENMNEGHIVYICKDDARMLEIPIYNPSKLEDEYKKDIMDITYFVGKKIEPSKENFIVFDNDFGKFSANWKVGYSNYLTLLYGLENQMEFDEKYKPIVEKWNRVLGRIKNGDKMTENNLEAIEEMKKEGFDIDKLRGIE